MGKPSNNFAGADGLKSSVCCTLKKAGYDHSSLDPESRVSQFLSVVPHKMDCLFRPAADFMVITQVNY